MGTPHPNLCERINLSVGFRNFPFREKNRNKKASKKLLAFFVF